MQFGGRNRDEELQRSDEEDMISFKPDWMKGNEAKNNNGRDRQGDKWRSNGRTRGPGETRDWNKGSSVTRDTRGWERDRGRSGLERSASPAFPSTQPKTGRFIPPPMNRSQSAGALFPPKKESSPQLPLLFSKDSVPTVVKAPAPPPSSKIDNFQLDRDSDFPSLQPAQSVEVTKRADSPNARSRFLKSKSTNALLEQRTPPRNGSLLLEKAGVLEEGKAPLLAGQETPPLAMVNQATIERDVNNTTKDSAHSGDCPSQSEASLEQEEQSDKPKLKKIPSFSEKVVEAITATQASGKTEASQSRKEEEKVHSLVPSKPAPPRPLIKSRSDRGHLLDHRKPLTKSSGAKLAETAMTPKPQPEIVQTPQVKPQESVVTKQRRAPSPLVYRKAPSDTQLLNLWKKDGVPGSRAAVEVDDSSGGSGNVKKDGKNGGRVVDKQLELRQQRRNLFLEQLRKREAMKNGELEEEEAGDKEEGSDRQGQEGEGKEETCTAAALRFSEEEMVSFMKQLGWSEEDYLDEGLTEEELSGVHPLDSVQLSKERKQRKENLTQSLLQWQPTTKGATTGAGRSLA